MKSLYINTTANLLQLCFKNGDEIHNFLSDGVKSQSEEVFEAISSVLGNVKISDLDFIAVAVGPGSFTGIRLGLSVVKGFLIATGVSVICVNNFEAVYYTF
ncbi:MAG: tRNA (adenosine(37)-N6)-threonylcarbamoyltransferase complex dimerization subunit type 1 TsaB, partial [Alphaproteobacteria bacterium]|nr:tRNA (adenosine(37)-N6)-threonylcarbamoyltransferase complex dimerization subunit type 1 TsaB [Alphaproteobacteria bacterium]